MSMDFLELIVFDQIYKIKKKPLYKNSTIINYLG